VVFKNLGLNKKFIAAFSFIIVAILLLSQFNLYQSYLSNKRASDIYSQELKTVENLFFLKGALYRIRNRLETIENSDSNSEIKYNIEFIKKQFDRTDKLIVELKKTRLNQEELRYLNAFKQNLGIIKEKTVRFLESDRFDKRKIDSFIKNEIKPFFGLARDSLNSLTKYQIQRARMRIQQNHHSFKTQLFVTEITLLIVLALSIYIGKKLFYAVANPLRKINEILEKVNRNNFNEKIDILENDELGYMASLLNQNIIMLKEYQNKLHNMAYTDSLTKLPNRRFFKEHIQSLIDNRIDFAILFVDLDNFKNVNDHYGHETGDILLKKVAVRLKSVLRDNDMIFRLGGDEFAIVIMNITSEITAANIANKLITATQKPYLIHNKKIFTSLSIGIYISEKEKSISKIMSFADIALYESKKKKGTYTFFDKTLYERFKNSFEKDVLIREAVKNNEFIYCFHPIVNLRSKQIEYVEVLLRWRLKDRLLPPGEFMSKLESTGLIVDITYKMIEDIFGLISQKKILTKFSINISILQFFDSYFIPFLTNITQRYKEVSPSQITFEITESILVKNSDYLQRHLSKIKRLGFKISLDDFGTGYSSLAYFKNFPIDTVKIDKEFTKNIIFDPKTKIIFKKIIELARELELEVVVEGVENGEQLEFIPKNKKVYVQGYIFYKPMPLDEVLKIIT